MTVLEGTTSLDYTNSALTAGEFRITGHTYSPSGFVHGAITGIGTSEAIYADIGSWSDTSATVGYMDIEYFIKPLDGSANLGPFTIRQSFTITREGGPPTAADDVNISSQAMLVVNAGSTTVGYRVHSDGTADGTTTTSGVYANLETWLNVGNNSDYDVKMVKSGGVGGLTSGTLDAWLSCGTTRTWSRTSASAFLWQGTLSIRHATSGVILDSCTIELEHDTGA
jgi:hypothetical protein